MTVQPASKSPGQERAHSNVDGNEQKRGGNAKKGQERDHGENGRERRIVPLRKITWGVRRIVGRRKMKASSTAGEGRARRRTPGFDEEGGSRVEQRRGGSGSSSSSRRRRRRKTKEEEKRKKKKKKKKKGSYSNNTISMFLGRFCVCKFLHKGTKRIN
jgi:hypothetical protein